MSESPILRRCPFCRGAYNIEIFGPMDRNVRKAISDGEAIACRGCRDAKTILCDPALPEGGDWTELEGRIIIGVHADTMLRIVEVRGDRKAVCAYLLCESVKTSLTLVAIQAEWLFLPIPILQMLRKEWDRRRKIADRRSE